MYTGKSSLNQLQGILSSMVSAPSQQTWEHKFRSLQLLKNASPVVTQQWYFHGALKADQLLTSWLLFTQNTVFAEWHALRLSLKTSTKLNKRFNQIAGEWVFVCNLESRWQRAKQTKWECNKEKVIALSNLAHSPVVIHLITYVHTLMSHRGKEEIGGVIPSTLVTELIFQKLHQMITLLALLSGKG